MEIYASNRNFERYGINQEIWERENFDHIIHIEPPTSGFPFTLYTIQLDASDYEIPPSWLKLNSDFIEYELSANEIENAHIIDNISTKEEINELIAMGHSINLTGKQLLEKKCSFSRQSFNDYMSLTIQEKKLYIDLINDFQENLNCYSFPFFWTIKFNNQETKIENCVFNFVPIEINQIATIAIKVNFSNGNKEYYDFTDRA